MKQKEYGVIIVGTGIAGLFAALSLPRETSVLMITKEELDKSDSYLAQGGIATLLGEDDYETYFNDTMRAGRYENNSQSVTTMIKASSEVVADLLEYGVEFDKAKDGTLAYTREGGHSAYRILHHQDITGEEIVSKLLKEVKQRSNITLLEYAVMVDFIIKENQCYGIVIRNKEETAGYYCNNVILATGGLGGLFQNSTNFPHITGDSFSLALRHNIELDNIHYIQIHPTVLYTKDTGRRFLVSESVRGEGAVLLNEDGERFINELLPRDVVAEAIRREMERFGTDHVYLSLAAIDTEKILTHFPNIYRRCLKEGYDITKENVPVTPAQHYLMGGIKTNIYGETSTVHLYAVGETACNGVHGANRLASNSLLESLVFAKNAANKVAKDQNDIILNSIGEKEKIAVDIQKYQDIDLWNEVNRQLLLQEIKRRDKQFYDKWCDI